MPRQIIWNLPVPLREHDLQRADGPPTLVQFGGGGTPSDEDHALLDEFLGDHPDTTVAVGAALVPDLGWLRHYRRAHRVRLDAYHATSFEPLVHLREDLTSLTVGETQRKGVSLAPLRRFTALRDLGIVTHTRDIAAVGALGTLESLALVRLALPGLDAFEPLAGLRELRIFGGGTTNLAALPRIGRLRFLEILRVPSLEAIDEVGMLAHLEYLALEQLGRVRRLPALAQCGRLRRIRCIQVGLESLDAIATAPALEELLLLDMPQLDLDAYRVLRGHATLRAATVGLRSAKKSAEIAAMLGLPAVENFGAEFSFADA